MNQLPAPFEPIESSPPRRIVCAAIMHRGTGRVMVGVRHYCPQMRDQIQHSQQGITYWKNVYQGFVDQYGKFHTREEAWTIAKEQGQIIREVDTPPGTLYSEHLY